MVIWLAVACFDSPRPIHFANLTNGEKRRFRSQPLLNLMTLPLAKKPFLTRKHHFVKPELFRKKKTLHLAEEGHEDEADGQAGERRHHVRAAEEGVVMMHELVDPERQALERREGEEEHWPTYQSTAVDPRDRQDERSHPRQMSVVTEKLSHARTP